MANLPNTAAGTAFVPTYNFKKSNAPKTRVVSFGLNQNAKIFNLTFEVSETDADTLTNFFDTIAVSGANFTYTVPGESAMNFVVEGGYNKTVPYLNRAKVQVIFRQVFEP